MESALEGDDLDPGGLALLVPVFPRHLDGELAGFGARVGEEHRVGEGQVDQPLCQLLALRAAVEVRRVPHCVRLLGQRLDQRRVGMTQRIDRDSYNFV